jgi:outer membrane biosynthesis protein TonB
MTNPINKISVILVAIILMLTVSTPVFADDTISEPGTGAGIEWDGNISEPTPTPTPQPTPAPQPAPEPTPTPTPQPTPAPQSTKPVSTPKTNVTNAVEPEAPAETPVETLSDSEAPTETPVETPAEPQTVTPEVPQTLTPISHTQLIAIVSGVATIFGVFVFWAIVRLIKIKKFEKFYNDALKRSKEFKKSNITRAG